MTSYDTFCIHQLIVPSLKNCASVFFVNSGISVDEIGSLTDNAARLHSVLVDLHQVVGQVAQLWLHDLWKNSLPSATELKNPSIHRLPLIQGQVAVAAG